MEQIPLMFGETRETETVLGPVIQAGKEAFKVSTQSVPKHSLIREVLIQSCSARAKNFTNYVGILSSTIQWCYPKY